MIPVQPIWNNLDQQTVVGVKVKLYFFLNTFSRHGVQQISPRSLTAKDFVEDDAK
jgi:hypothetical protein